MLKKMRINPMYLTIIVSLLLINGIVYVEESKSDEIKNKFYSEYKKIIENNNLLLKHYLNNLPEINCKAGFCKIKEKSNTAIFIFGFYKNSCQSCIDDAILNLKNISSKIGIHSILIVSDINFTDLEAIKSLYQITDYNFIILDPSEFPTCYGRDQLFYCVVDSSNIARMVFTPYPHMPDLSESYFEKVIDQYYTH
jgi:hypothetical protein